MLLPLGNGGGNGDVGLTVAQAFFEECRIAGVWIAENSATAPKAVGFIEFVGRFKTGGISCFKHKAIHAFTPSKLLNSTEDGASNSLIAASRSREHSLNLGGGGVFAL